MRRSLLAALGVLTASFFFVHFAFAQTTTITLVSNFSHSDAGNVTGTEFLLAQGFDTGSSVRQIESVKFEVNTAVADHASDTFTVKLHNAFATYPGSTSLATFSADHDTIESTGEKTVTLSEPYKLQKNGKYFIVLTYSGSSTFDIAKVDNDGQTGESGWEIDNRHFNRGAGNWFGVSEPLRIEIKGSKLPIDIDNDNYSTSETEKEINGNG